MNIGLYSELYEGAGLGGREYLVAILAEGLAKDAHRVEFVHHLSDLSVEKFCQHFGIRSDSIELRRISTRPPATWRSLVRSGNARRRWTESLSKKYDIFINIVHDAPARCYAKRGVLVILFPFFKPFEVWSGLEIESKKTAHFWVLVRYLSYHWQWTSLMRSYQLKSSISRYSQTWSRRRWKVDTEVIYPPADSSLIPAEKTNCILSVGRFSGFRIGGVSKRQLEMMRVFAALAKLHNGDWEYHSLGGLGGWPQDKAYLQEIEDLSKTISRAHVSANAPREVLRKLYGNSKIFWHAAGYGDDDSDHPELMEHFGIATVDAMMAGCVPIVINKGAQPEIVEHGTNGFLWNTLDELRHFTERLMNDDILRCRMAAAARERAKNFSEAVFMQRFRKFLAPVIK